MTPEAITAVGIVIPVHNEEALLGDCLAAVAAAADAVSVRVATEIVVVLDACTDRSAEIATRGGLRQLHIDAKCVGRARQAGVDAVLARFAGCAPDEIWIAHTDADSVVPAHWIMHQLDLAEAGADVVIGTVRPDFRDLTASQVQAWKRTHRPGIANGHVHGANLGIRAGALAAAGGFDSIPLHEDVRLVDRARRAGARLVASDEAWVRTSGRQLGRAPGGYARYLREDLVPLAESLQTSG